MEERRSLRLFLSSFRPFLLSIPMGYLYSILAAGAFAVLGVSYKLSDKLDCDKRQVNLFLYVTGSAVGLVWVLAARPPFGTMALGLGAIVGLISFVNVVAFRHAVSLGRLSTSWTILNLAVVMPVLASVVVWREMPSARHYAGFLLAVIAIVLLGKDIERAGE